MRQASRIRQRMQSSSPAINKGALIPVGADQTTGLPSIDHLNVSPKRKSFFAKLKDYFTEDEEGTEPVQT